VHNLTLALQFRSGIRQFLIDFPFKLLTEICLLRCQLVLRIPSKFFSLSLLYDLPTERLLKELKTGLLAFFNEKFSKLYSESLHTQLLSFNDDYCTHTLSTIASIISHSSHNVHSFLVEVIELCFLNEDTRDSFYKVI
jgi:hypothetical protein